MSENALRETRNNVDETMQWVTFQVGEELYGVNVLQVQKVFKYTEITPVPVAHLTMYLGSSIYVAL